MDSITQQLEDMILGRVKEGPSIIDQYKSSLETAATQDQGGIDALRGIYNDPSKFERSKLGAFGLGLMAPTKSGTFNEGMFNALSAATAAQDYNREQNLSREEKLAKLSALEAQLTRQRADDRMGVYDKQSNWMKSAQDDQQTLSDLRLSGQPPGPRPLNPGEFGPEAPGSDYLSQNMKLYNDYLQNPGKYAGPQGQAMVKNAIDVLKNERNNKRAENVAGMRNANRPEISAPEQRRISSRLKELDVAAEDARGLKSSVAFLRSARDKIGYEGTPGAGLYSSLTGWATDSGAAGQEVNSYATDMKLGLSQKLKGAISNAEQAMLERATPGLDMADAAAEPVLKAYDAAADRAVDRSKFMKAWFRKNGSDYGADEAWDAYVNENPILSEGKDGNLVFNEKNTRGWENYIIDINAEDGPPPQQSGVDPELGFDPNSLSPEDRAWAKEQIDGGADPQAVIEELRKDYGGN